MKNSNSKTQHSSPLPSRITKTFKLIHHDFEKPLTPEDLLAIDAAFESVSTTAAAAAAAAAPLSSPVSTNTTDDARPRTRRRFPISVPLSYPEPDGTPTPASFELTHCPTNSVCLQASTTLNPLSSSNRINTRRGYSSLDNTVDHARLRTRRRLPDSISKPNGIAVSARDSDSFSLTPCRANYRFCTDSVNSRYPAMKFGGRIVYCRTIREVEEATSQILKLLEAKKSELGRAILGLDIEWRPSFKRGIPPGKASVMQICGDMTHCYVLHIFRSGIPHNLQSLLEDSSSIKVGVGIGNDAVKVFHDHNVSVKSVQDLSALANQKLGGVPKKWSLSSLVETLTCKQLPKSNKIRLGNWEANVLSKAQLQYAATDAFASWYMYEVLQSFPDPPENETQT